MKIFGRRDPKANIFKLVHEWLHDSRKSKWTLILDNVDDARFLLSDRLNNQAQTGNSDSTASRPLHDYLPQSQNGSVLITSRSKEAARQLIEERDIIAVEPMDESHALALFKTNLGKQGESQDISELAAALEYMPLAIVQAAAYISQRSPRCSVHQYLEEFRKSDRKKMSLLNHEGGQLRRDRKAKNSILITWQISFKHIHQTRQSAAELLSLMSFFDPQGIPEILVRGRAGDAEHEIREGRDDNGEQSDEDSDSELNNDGFEIDVRTLRDFSFISTTSDPTVFEMHRLVQLATRKWLEANEQLEKWKEQYIKILYEELPNGEYENWTYCRALFPHAKSAVTQRTKGDGSRGTSDGDM